MKTVFVLLILASAFISALCVPRVTYNPYAKSLDKKISPGEAVMS